MKLECAMNKLNVINLSHNYLNTNCANFMNYDTEIYF